MDERRRVPLSTFRLAVLLMATMVIGLACPSVTGAAPDDLVLGQEPPPAPDNELPSPIPVAKEFIEGMMNAEFDRCLANFNVKGFLLMVFDQSLRSLTSAQYLELYAYQVQAQRTEFRFHSRVMNRLAGGAKFVYGNPSIRGKQARISVKVFTHKGNQEFVVFLVYADEQWQVYDYQVAGKRFASVFRAGLGGISLANYVASLRPFYNDKLKYEQHTNEEFGIKLKVPSLFTVRANVAPTLLFSMSALDGRVLVHVQGKTYDTRQNLQDSARELKNALMPYNPRLFDQYRSDIAGVEMGHVIFRFDRGNKTLFTHMLIVPIGNQLITVNFYHSSLPVLKNFTNIRDQMLENLVLTRVESPAAVNAGLNLPSEDTDLPDTVTPVPPPDGGTGDDLPPPPGGDVPPPPPPPDDDVPPPPPPPDDDVPPPPPPDDDVPPPPPPDYDDPPPPPPPPPPPDDSGGTDVSF